MLVQVGRGGALYHHTLAGPGRQFWSSRTPCRLTFRVLAVLEQLRERVVHDLGLGQEAEVALAGGRPLHTQQRSAHTARVGRICAGAIPSSGDRRPCRHGRVARTMSNSGTVRQG